MPPLTRIRSKLSLKLVLGALIIPAVAGGVIGDRLLHHEQGQLRKGLVQKVAFLAKQGGFELRPSLATGNTEEATQSLARWLKGHPDALFAEVEAHPAGEVIAAIGTEGYSQRQLRELGFSEAGVYVHQEPVLAGLRGSSLGSTAAGKNKSNVVGVFFIVFSTISGMFSALSRELKIPSG